MNLNDLDLNLLRVFNQLMVDRNVSRVARALGVSQPAVSNALKRLRLLLGDELFLRTAQGMQPTPLAEQIAEPIASALETIRVAVSQQPVFEPDRAERSFTIATTELGELYVLPRLLAKIGKEAPRISLVTTSSGGATLKDDLESGRTDIALGTMPQLQGGYFRQRLFKEPYALAYRKGHPLDRKSGPSKADLSAQKRLLVTSSSLEATEIERHLQQAGLKPIPQATVSHVTGIGPILTSSDLVAILPSGVANLLSSAFGLRGAPLPVAVPDYSMDIYWHARLHRDPANQWLRRRIFDLLAETGTSRS